MNNLKKIFIASSNKEREFAEKIAGMLEEIEGIEVISWWEDNVFIPGQITLKEILRATEGCDGGVFIFDKSEDSHETDVEKEDKSNENNPSTIKKKDNESSKRKIPSGNVLIEAGMFCGMRDPATICLLTHADSNIDIPSDFSGLTMIVHSDDKKFRTKAKLRTWVGNIDHHKGKYILADNHGIKSTIPVFMADKSEIEECIPLNVREKDAIEIRLVNYAGTSFLSNSEIADSYDKKWTEWFDSALNGGTKITLVLTAPNSYAAKDAEKYKMYPPMGSKTEIKDIIPKNIEKINKLYKEHKNIKLAAYLTDIALPYAIFETRFKDSEDNHIKVDLYSPLMFNDDKRPSFMVYKKENPKLYKHFSDVIDHIIYIQGKKIKEESEMKNENDNENDEVFHLTKETIDNALSNEYRQYFIGELSRPQLLNHLEQGDLEIGTSLYKNSKADAPHMHNKTSEILYIIKGTYKVLDINADKEYTLNAGDFFVIPPQTPYASKAKFDTQVLFIKTGGNDKVVVDVSEGTQKWLNEL